MESDVKKTRKKVIDVKRIPSYMKKSVSTTMIALMLFFSAMGLSGCSTEEKIIPGYNIEYVDKSDHVYKTAEGEYFYKTNDLDYAIPVEDYQSIGSSKFISYSQVLNALDEFDDLKEFLTSYGIEDAVSEYEEARKQSNVELMNTTYSKVALLTLKGMLYANIIYEPIQDIESIKISPVQDDFTTYEECIATVTFKPKKEIVSGGIEVEGKPEVVEFVITDLYDYFESIIKAQEGKYTVEEIDVLYGKVIDTLLFKGETVHDDSETKVKFTEDKMKRLELKYSY